MSVTNATPEQIDEALQLLVKHGGNAAKAAEDEKCPWSVSSLKNWRRDYQEKYRRLELAYTDELEDATRARAQEVAHQAGDLEVELLEKVKAKIGSMDGREAAQALRAVSDSKGRNIDKWMTLSGRNPDGNRNRDDDWALIEGGIRSGVLKLAPGLTGANGATASDDTAAAAPDTTGAESGDAESNV